MSAGFRVFLLIVAAFGAIYAYRFRHPEISRWLKAESPAPPADPLDCLISPVDRILERHYSVAHLVLKSPPRPEPEPSPPAEMPAADPDALARELAEAANDLAPQDQGEASAELDGESVVDAAPAPDLAGGESPPPDAAEPPRLDHRYQEVEYTVESGDSLWRIAASQLGSGSRHAEIVAWNPEIFRHQNPDLLVAGTVLKLRLPAAEEMLKVPPGAADSTVEGNSGGASQRPEASRKLDRTNARSKRVARR